MAYVVSVTEKDQEKQNRSIRNAHERLTTAEADIEAIEADISAAEEFSESEVLAGSAVSLTTATAANITSLSLAAGVWDVEGWAVLAGAGGASPTTIRGWVSATSAAAPTLPNKGGINYLNSAGFASNATNVLPTGQKRFTLSETTTIYLSGQAFFVSGTMTAYGYLAARRNS
jgi:hypothetical protein